MARTQITRPPIERFLSHVDKNGPIPRKCPERGPCWLSDYAKDRGGYAKVGTYGETASCLLHRRMYGHFRGPVPPKMDLHHACENPGCCNPWHLDAMTHEDHFRRHPDQGTVAAAIQRSKTRCPHGHEYTSENTGYRKNGDRYCRECRRLSGKAERRVSSAPTMAERNRAKDHCRQGHPYDEKNTYIDSHGNRSCRACRRIYALESYYRHRKLKAA